MITVLYKSVLFSYILSSSLIVLVDFTYAYYII